MTIYTFGYTGKDVSALCREVDRLNALVIDTRLRPFARVASWRRGPLAAQLGASYAYFPEFGNVNYKRGGPIALQDYPAGLERLRRLLPPGVSPILLCVCSDVTRCHRAVVAVRLARDLEACVVHR